ncbi:MAG TPA: SRPBCC domain-containing protein [Candidatus Limnocylindrales bacterium]
MNVHGTHHTAAPRAAVFDAIRDPRALLEVIPGCESVEEVAPDEYEGRITLRLPGAVGSYRTRVRLIDVEAPERAGLDGRVDGPMGSITGRAAFSLTEDAAPAGDTGDDAAVRAAMGTTITWRGTGTIHGPLARLDGRFAERLAESLVEQGLRALDGRLTTTTTTEGPE